MALHRPSKNAIRACFHLNCGPRASLPGSCLHGFHSAQPSDKWPIRQEGGASWLSGWRLCSHLICPQRPHPFFSPPKQDVSPQTLIFFLRNGFPTTKLHLGEFGPHSPLLASCTSTISHKAPPSRTGEMAASGRRRSAPRETCEAGPLLVVPARTLGMGHEQSHHRTCVCEYIQVPDFVEGNKSQIR